MKYRRTIRRWHLRIARALREEAPEPGDPQVLEERSGTLLLRVLLALLAARTIDGLDGGLAVGPFRELREHPGSGADALRAALGSLRDGFGGALLSSGNLIPTPLEDELLGSCIAALDRALVAAPDLDTLGEAHQQIERTRLVTDEGTLQRDRSDARRQSGLFFTPPELVDCVVSRTFPDQYARPSALPRVLDPAMGSGAFLCRGFQTLLDARRQLAPDDSDRRHIRTLFARHLYGVDLDGRAVDLARWNLRFAALARTSEPLTLESIAEPARLASGDALVFATPAEADRHGGAYGRALAAAHDLPPEECTPLHWAREFPEVLGPDAETPGFDAVVGNPPWVSFGLRDVGSHSEAIDSYLRERFAGSAQYKLPLYPMFMELAVRLARDGGTTSLVVPDSFLTGSRFSEIRGTLLDETDLQELAVLDEGLWSGGTSGRTVVYRARVGGETDSPVQLRRADDPEALSGGGADSTVPQSELERGPERRFQLVFDRDGHRLVDCMRRADGRLGELVDFYSGAIARYGQQTVRADEPRTSWTIRDRDGAPVVEDTDAADHWRPLVPSGRFLSPFELYRPGARLYFHPEPDVRRRYAKSGFDPTYYEAPKLLLRQTGDDLVAALDREGIYCFNNLHVAISDSHEHLLFALGLLNSRPLRTFHRITSLDGDRSLAQIAIDALRELPVPAPQTDAAECIRDCARRCHALGSRLADADRLYRRALDVDAERARNLGALDGELETFEIRPNPRLPNEGRLTDLDWRVRSGDLLLSACLDDRRRDIVTLHTDRRTTRNRLFLALRELLRRRWRKRLWADGPLPEDLLRNLELRLPATRTAARDDVDLVDVAQKLCAERDNLDQLVASAYGLEPDHPAIVGSTNGRDARR